MNANRPQPSWMSALIVVIALGALLSSAGSAAGGVGKSKGKKPDAPQVQKGKGVNKGVKKKGRVRRGLTVVGATGEKTTDTTNLPAGTPAAKGKDGPPRITGRVVYGDAKGGGVIATVDVKKVFGHIPAYRKISQENLKKTKARYHFLISQANEAFQQAVELEASTKSVDVVVEKGGVENADQTVVDLTDKVIKRIERG